MNDVETLKDLADYAFDGRRILGEVIRSSSYETPAQAVAALTKFSHPQTVAQTRNHNIFRIIRGAASERGCYVNYKDGSQVMLDDNSTPTNVLVWANSISLKGYSNIQFNHIWPGAKDVNLYTSLANLCVTPAFLAKLTDTDKEICGLLRYRVYELYDGFKPDNEPDPLKPDGYDGLVWASPLPEVNNLEFWLRQAIRTKPKDRTVCSIQELGWYFSDFKPEPTVKPI